MQTLQGCGRTRIPRIPSTSKSRTGCVITVSGCPVLWFSKLQTETALSTMEAEYVALSTSCRELLPIIRLVKGVAKAVGLTPAETTDMHVSIHEDNAGALVLAKMEPPRMTPRSKHYCVKYHWFREQLGPQQHRTVQDRNRAAAGRPVHERSPP